jgi:hypothetical protein
MGADETLKDVASIAQKIDNIELVKQVIDLQQQVFALFEKHRALKERLEMRYQLTFKNNSYRRGEDGPYCQAVGMEDRS